MTTPRRIATYERVSSEGQRDRETIKTQTDALAARLTTAEAVAERPGWGVMAAVRTGAVRVADDKLITRPGPRLAQGLRSLILAIHPEAALP